MLGASKIAAPVEGAEAETNKCHTHASMSVTEAAAVGKEKIDELVRLLKNGEDPNELDENGNAAMHYAALNNDVQSAQLLIDYECDISKCDDSGATPLHAAALVGSVGVARLLLQAGADTTLRDDQGATSMDVAVLNYQTTIVELFESHNNNNMFDDLADAFSAAQSPMTWKEEDVTPAKYVPAQSVSESKPVVIPFIPRMRPGPLGTPFIPLPPDSPGKKLTTIFDPTKESSMMIKYEITGNGSHSGLELYPNSVLRCVLPSWASARLVRNILIRHRSVAAGNADSSESVSVYNKVKLWGCSLGEESFPGTTKPVPVGSTVLLFGLAAKEFNGMVGRVANLKNDGKVEVIVHRSREVKTFNVKQQNIKVIRDEALWWDYVNTTTQYNVKTGIFAPLRPESDPAVAAFCDWNCHVGMLYAGCIDIDCHGETTSSFSIIHDITIEFFPANYVVVSTDMKVMINPNDYILQTKEPHVELTFHETEGGGATLLHWAAWKNDKDAAIALLEMGDQSGADIRPEEAITEGGSTPLHWAAKQDSFEVAETLLKYGASPYAKNKNGDTPLSIVELKGSTDMISLIATHTSNGKQSASPPPPSKDELLEQFMDGGITGRTNTKPSTGAESLSPARMLKKKIVDAFKTPSPLRPKANVLDGSVNNNSPSSSSKKLAARRALIKKEPGEKMGFRLHSPVGTHGTRIIGIVPNGPADRAGNLKEGDLILSVNGVPVLQKHHNEVVDELKSAGNEALLLVIEPDRMEGSVGSLQQNSTLQTLSPDSKSRLQSKSSAIQLRRISKKKPNPIVFPAGSPVPLETFNEPQIQSANSIKFETLGIILSPDEHLRFELPHWCSARIIKNVTVSQKKNISDQESVSCYNGSILYDTLPVSTKVSVWGVPQEDPPTSKEWPKGFLGRNVALCGYQDSDQCGLLGIITATDKKNMVKVKLHESKEVVATTVSNLRFINGSVRWWDYETDKFHYDPTVGIQATIAQAGIPSAALFAEWNVHVGPLLVGAVNLSAAGNGSAIINSVTIDFFPQHIPAPAGAVLRTVQEAFIGGQLFCSLQTGVGGIQTSIDIKIPQTDLVKLGSGWIKSGSIYSPAEPWSASEIGSGSMDTEGVLHIPLHKGQHVLGFELAISHWVDPDIDGQYADQNKITNPACRIWAKFPRHDDLMALDHVPIPKSGIITGGPIGHDFVALEGDELLIGTRHAPARILGYRVIQKQANSVVEEISVLRNKDITESERMQILSKEIASKQAVSNLEMDIVSVAIDGSSSEYFAAGAFGQVFMGQHRRQACLIQYINRFELINDDEIYQRRFASDLAAMSLHSGHPSVLRITGLYFSRNAIDIDGFSVRFCVVYEPCGGGTLRGYLDSNKPKFPLENIKLLEDVAYGMDYLHSRKPNPIIHADLKSTVVLLRGSGQIPCITDYGLAKYKQLQVEHNTKVLYPDGFDYEHDGLPPWSPEWAAPELWHWTGIPNRSTDIYAFGILMYEALSGEVAWEGTSTEQIRANVLDRKRPQGVDLDGYPTLKNLIQRCWDHEPDRRPENFQVIGDLLQEVGKASESSDGSTVAWMAARLPESLPEALNDSDLPWKDSTRPGVKICFIDQSSSESGLALTLRQQIVSLCADSSAHNQNLSKDFKIGNIHIVQNPKHSLSIAMRMISLTAVNYPNKWASERPKFGGRTFKNNKHTAKWRQAALNRLKDQDLYRLTPGGNPNCRDHANLVTVFYPVSSDEDAFRELSEESHTGSGLYGKGVHAYLDIHHAFESASSDDGPVTLVVAHAVFRNVFPVTGCEIPGESDALIGGDIVGDHDSHLVISLRGESCPLVPAFWHVSNPSAMMVFREDCVLPFASITIQKKHIH